MRDIGIVVVWMAIVAAATIVALVLSQRVTRRLERREEQRLQRDIAESERLHDLMRHDPRAFIAHLRATFPDDDLTRELIEDLEQYAARCEAHLCTSCEHTIGAHWEDDERGQPGCHHAFELPGRACLCPMAPSDIQRVRTREAADMDRHSADQWLVRDE